jgi:hypothetical protein
MRMTIDQSSLYSPLNTNVDESSLIPESRFSRDCANSAPLDAIHGKVLGDDTSSEDSKVLRCDTILNIPDENLCDFGLSILMTDKMCFNNDARQRDHSVLVLGRLAPVLDMRTVHEMVRAFTRDLRGRLDARIPGYDDRKHPGSEAVLGCLDTEGWGSLETSLKGLRTLLRSTRIDLGTDFLAVLDVVSGSIRHKNRYAREQGQLCFAEILSCRDVNNRVPVSELLVTGLRDNWSQVRYASLIALKSYLRDAKGTISEDAVSDEVLTHFLINRHFPAEGVRRLAQEVWRIFTGPQGGRDILIPRIIPILGNLSALIESDNHSIREAIVSVSLELAKKVFPHVAESPWETGSRTVKLCIYGLEDDAWFIRQAAMELTMVLFETILTDKDTINAKYEFFVTKSERILDLLLLDTASSILCLQKQSTRTIVSLLLWQLELPSQVIMTKLVCVMKTACEQNNLKEMLLRSSGNAHHHNPHENQVMYSCGSLMSNRDLRRSTNHSTSDECCSSLGPTYTPDIINIITGMMELYLAILEHPILSVHKDMMCLKAVLLPLIGQTRYVDECSPLKKLSMKIRESWCKLDMSEYSY